MSIQLNNLKINQKGIIKKVKCNDKITRRLYDLGLLEGTIICPIFSSPFGDPIAYEFRGNIIAIRAEDAQKIKVEIEESKER